MKKTPVIILTLVASLSISLSSAESNRRTTIYPPDFLYESEFLEADTTKYDTLRRDSTNHGYPTQISYNYYYRNPLWDNLFRIFRPRRYHALINQPGYIPRHTRSDHRAMARRSLTSAGHRPSRGSSSSRGGFGHSGSSNTQFN